MPSIRRLLRNMLRSSKGDIDRVIVLLWLMIVIGLLSLLVPASIKFLAADWAGGLTVLAAGLFLAGASTVSGSAIGFLFGVPRKAEETQSRDKNSSGPVTKSELYQPNTNLEQISDWLTKIIVGVGLTQIPAILDHFDALGNLVGPAFGTSPLGKIIALALVVHYLIVGFFQGFLLAYLWLPGAFVRAMALERQVDEARGNDA